MGDSKAPLWGRVADSVASLKAILKRLYGAALRIALHHSLQKISTVLKKASPGFSLLVWG